MRRRDKRIQLQLDQSRKTTGGDERRKIPSDGPRIVQERRERPWDALGPSEAVRGHLAASQAILALFGDSASVLALALLWMLKQAAAMISGRDSYLR